MTTELILVEGVSDAQLISYYLQNVYGWKHERENILGIERLKNTSISRAFLGMEIRLSYVVWVAMVNLLIS